MPRPDRSTQGSPSPQAASHPSAPVQQNYSAPAGGIREDIRALNSSILLITQKIKYLLRNEKILGRNLVVLNKKIRTIEERMNLNPVAQEGEGASSAEVVALTRKVALLEAQIEDMQSRIATKEEVKEVKFVIDSINPLEFATLSQVRDLIDKKMKEKTSK
jgi:TolA-binding protein